MTSRIDVPDPFALVPFSVADAVDAGLTRRRLIGADLARPMRGVRTAAPIADRAGFVLAAATRLKPWQAIAASSAVALWGIPIPARLARRAGKVIVATEHGNPVPTAEAFRGIRLSGDRLGRSVLDGVVVTDPVTTWCLLSRELTRDELVAAGDCLVTPSTRYEGRHPQLPVLAIEDLALAHERWGRSPGSRVRSAALERIRVGVDSPMESELRCALVNAGLPEPRVHFEVPLRNGVVVHPDLAYVRERIAIEYEGDRHRELGRFRRDIVRREDFEDVGWHVVRSTAADLRPDPRVIARRVQRARERRAP